VNNPEVQQNGGDLFNIVAPKQFDYHSYFKLKQFGVQ